MNRSISAVLLGTFTLRFSTGLTGGLLVYYLDALPEYGGVQVASTTVGILTATYFLAELVLSPPFGYLSDRYGAHRIMQIGPIFGVVAVLITAITVDLWIIGGTRLLEGAAAAASIPSILGYIALATSGDQSIRGRAVSRFEAATLLGIGFGIVAAGPIFDAIGRVGFVINARHLRPVVPHLPLGRGRAAPRAGVGRRGGRPRAADRSAWTWAATAASWARRGSGCWPRPGSR